MALMTCSDCARDISDRAPACPHCGAPRAPLAVPGLNGSSTTGPGATASEAAILWTFCFGALYFLYKGWIKSALVYMAATVLTGGVWWFIGPFFAHQIVRYCER